MDVVEAMGNQAGDKQFTSGIGVKIMKMLPKAKSIAKFITCSSCGDYKTLPPSICEKGHLTCCNCADGETCCPYYVTKQGKKCERSFTSDKMEIITYFYNLSTFSCPNAFKGCEVELFGEEIEYHMDNECTFRPLHKCVVTGCLAKAVPLEIFPYHLREDHKIPHSNQNNISITCLCSDLHFQVIDNRSADTKPVLTMDCYGASFSVFACEYKENFIIWIAHISAEKNGEKKYKGIVRLSPHQPQDSNVQPRVFVFPVKSLRDNSLRKMYEEEECMIIDKFTLRDNYRWTNAVGQDLYDLQLSIEKSNKDSLGL